jgi:hypothetical protein
MIAYKAVAAVRGSRTATLEDGDWHAALARAAGPERYSV